MPRTAKATLIPTEDQEQTRLASWLMKSNILFFAIPNGGSRHLFEAVKLKRMGVMAGVPDIFIPIARASYHGIFLELKRQDGGKISDSQRYWHEALKKEHYCVCVSKGFDEAKKEIESYLSSIIPS